MKKQTHKFCIAPMMDWTDRNCRAFHRHLSRHALLYTEMVTADAILHGDLERLLDMTRSSILLRFSWVGSEPRQAGARRAHWR